MLRLPRTLVFASLVLSMSIAAKAQWDIEADPTAYILSGYSAHVGRPIGDGRLRLQLGAFAAETPEWMDGNAGFSEFSRGVTLKLDYFPVRPLRGLFIGADSNYAHVRYELDQTRERSYHNLVALGPRIGYRFNCGRHVYIVPWVSVDDQFHAKNVVISRKTFRESGYSIFPAIHVGWRF